MGWYRIPVDDYMEYGKSCSCCGNWKTWDSFYKATRHYTGYQQICSDCRRKKAGQEKRTVPYDSKGRICAACEKYKTWDHFHKNKGGVAGHKSICKECRTKKKGYSPREVVYNDDNGKVCTECGEYKEWEEYHTSPNELKGYSSKCKRCLSEIHKERNAGPVKYDSYFDKLTIDDSPKPDADGNLTVKCSKCGKRHAPIRASVMSRVAALNGKIVGESRFYCSENCKALCPVYGRQLYQENHPLADKKLRVSSYLTRQLAFQHHGTVCQKCGKAHGKQNLIVHHKFPFKVCYMFEVDVDNLMVVCKHCHDEIHQSEGCGFGELANIVSYYYDNEDDFEYNNYLTQETKQENQVNV